MLKKRGSTQVDWAISLALFLFYITWFFIFVNPNFRHPLSAEDLILPLERAIEDEIVWEVQEYPLYIISTYEDRQFPVVIDFPFTFAAGEFGIENVHYELDNDKLIFLTALEEGVNSFVLTSSSAPYPNPAVSPELFIIGNTVSSSNIKGVFNDFHLTQIEFNESSRIENMEFLFNSRLFEGLDTNVNQSNSTLHYRKTVETEFMNVSTFIFANSSHILHTITPNYDTNLSRYDFELTADVINYGSYFASNNRFGQINYADPDCLHFNQSFIDFFEPAVSGVAFVMSNFSGIDVCYDRDDVNRRVIELSIDLPLSSSSYIYVSFHKGNFTNASKFITIPETFIGAGMIKRGISQEKVKTLFLQDYTVIKKDFRISNTRDFSINISNSTKTFHNFEPFIPGFNTNIFVKEKECNLLDKFGYQIVCKLRMHTW